MFQLTNNSNSVSNEVGNQIVGSAKIKLGVNTEEYGSRKTCEEKVSQIEDPTRFVDGFKDCLMMLLRRFLNRRVWTKQDLWRKKVSQIEDLTGFVERFRDRRMILLRKSSKQHGNGAMRRF